MRSTIVNLSLPAALLRMIDQEARVELRTRSELLREAARAYLGREQRWRALQHYARQRARTAGIRNEADVMQAVSSVRRATRSRSSD